MTSFKFATLDTSSLFWDKLEKSWEVRISSDAVVAVEKEERTARLEQEKNQGSEHFSSDTLCVLPQVRDGEGQAGSGKREPSSGNTTGAP